LIKSKQNVEQGFAETIQKIAYPRTIAKVGDPTHPPSQGMIDDIANKLADMEAQHQYIFPYYVDLSVLESKKSDKVQDNLGYFIDGIVSGLGGPKPFITGSGEATNRATLSDMKLLLERSFKTQQRQLSYQIEREVFTLLARQYNFKSVPKLVWDEVSTESIDSKVERLVALAKSGLLVPDVGTRNLLRRMERLPEEVESNADSQGETAGTSA
jgi:hypothetical protein